MSCVATVGKRRLAASLESRTAVARSCGVWICSSMYKTPGKYLPQVPQPGEAAGSPPL